MSGVQIVAKIVPFASIVVLALVKESSAHFSSIIPARSQITFAPSFAFPLERPISVSSVLFLPNTYPP